MAKALKLYWWKGKANFGDLLSPLIVRYVSGADVTHEWETKCDMAALGSILNCGNESKSGKPFYYWGTGSMTGEIKRDNPHVVYSAVRGKLTAAAIGDDNLPIGDPGVLVSDFIAKAPGNGKIGLIFHHEQTPPDAVTAFAAANPDTVTIIDPVNPDAIAVVKAISACSHIISSSLHGIIVADSYGIPNTWLNPHNIHASPRFKFQDYASSVGRDMGDPLPIDKLIEHAKSIRLVQGPPKYFDGVQRSKIALIRAFPAGLMG